MAAIIALTVGLGLAIALLPSQNDSGSAAGSACTADASGEEQIPAEYRDAVEQAAADSGISPAILAAQIEQESSWNPDATSSAGAKGIAQFMPGTWEQWGNGGDITDPQDAIAAQGRYMGHLYDEVSSLAESDGNRIRLALAAYNAGLGAVQEHDGVPPFNETRNYVDTIMDAAQGDYTSNCQALSPTVTELGSGEWTHPLPGGQQTSGFGSRPCPAGAECNEYTTNHQGLDFSTGSSDGTVVAPADMTVTATGSNQYQGHYIVARLSDDEVDATELPVFEFHHCQPGSITVSEGETVPVTTPICTEGTTGNSSAAHLHFQINAPTADDTQPTYEHAVDPAPILREKGVL